MLWPAIGHCCWGGDVVCRGTVMPESKMRIWEAVRRHLLEQHHLGRREGAAGNHLTCTVLWVWPPHGWAGH